MNAVDSAISSSLGQIPTEVATHAPEILLGAVAVGVLAFGRKYVGKLLGR